MLPLRDTWLIYPLNKPRVPGETLIQLLSGESFSTLVHLPTLANHIEIVYMWPGSSYIAAYRYIAKFREGRLMGVRGEACLEGLNSGRITVGAEDSVVAFKWDGSIAQVAIASDPSDDRGTLRPEALGVILEASRDWDIFSADGGIHWGREEIKRAAGLSYHDSIWARRDLVWTGT